MFTGTLSDFTRDEARRIVETSGGRVASGVSSGVDYVVVGESPGSKLNRAGELGIPILTEAEFSTLTGH